MKAQHRRNFRFFDAPVGMIFTIHRKLETGFWLGDAIGPSVI